MIEPWARAPVTLALIGYLALITFLVLVAAPFIPMMAGPKDAR